MTDWTPQDDWSQVKVGDQVRVMRAEQMLTGEVVDRFYMNDMTQPYALALRVEVVAGTIKIGHIGWQLSVPAKPAVVLPTEEGWYLAFDKLAEAPFPVELDASGALLINHTGGNPMKLGDPERFAPFTPLKPVAVTAKKVLDAIDELWTPGNIRDFTPHHSRRIAEQFGVSNG